MTMAPASIAISDTRTKCKGKAGRPALPGERYPGGKLKPAEKREGGPAPAEIKRTFDAALRKIGKDPVIGTSLGLLFMEAKITAPQLAAGLAFARLQGRYDRAIERPGRSTLSPDYGAARFISSKVPMAEDEVVAAKDRHARMKIALGGSMTGGVTLAAGDGTAKRLDGEAARSVRVQDARRSFALLERVCADDLACEGYEIDRLRAALQLLVPWFGIDARKGA